MGLLEDHLDCAATCDLLLTKVEVTNDGDASHLVLLGKEKVLQIRFDLLRSVYFPSLFARYHWMLNLFTGKKLLGMSLKCCTGKQWNCTKVKQVCYRETRDQTRVQILAAAMPHVTK